MNPVSRNIQKFEGSFGGKLGDLKVGISGKLWENLGKRWGKRGKLDKIKGIFIRGKAIR